MKKQDLEKAINDSARKIPIRGTQAIVPLKFDKDGDVVSHDTSPDRMVFKRLTLDDLRFLKIWRTNNWDVEKSREEAQVSEQKVILLVRKLSCFRAEDAKVRALAEIPTPNWVAAKDVQSIYEGGTLSDSEHKSLDRLAKITGAFKTSEVNITQNVFNLPQLSPEATAAIKAIADKEADVIEAQVA